MSSPWAQFDDWEKSEQRTPPNQLCLSTKSYGGSEDRFWQGQDSSNDPRSSESVFDEVLSKEGLEILPRLLGSGGVDIETGFGKQTMATWGVIAEVEEQQSQVALPSKHSSYPSTSGDAKKDGADCLLIDDASCIGDPFEGFDVLSGSEKDFLIENLKNDAPEYEIVALRQAHSSPSPGPSSFIMNWDTTMTIQEFDETAKSSRVSDRDFGGRDWQEFKFLLNAGRGEIDARIYELILSQQDENGKTILPSLEYPAPYLILRKKIEHFAQAHIFNVNKDVKPTTLQRREYTRDVYDYARALGMGKHQANVEVKRARAAYRRERGLREGFSLDDTDEESELGPEISDSVEYISCMTKGMVNGPVDPAGAWAELTRLASKAIAPDAQIKKRKHDGDDDKFKVSESVTASARSRPSQERINHRERKRRKKLETQLKSEKSVISPTVAAGVPVVGEVEKRKKNKRRKRKSLGKAEETTHLQSDGQSPNIPASKASSLDTIPLDIAVNGSKTVQTGSIKGNKDKELKNLGKMGSGHTTDHNKEPVAAVDIDLRREKEKKRKRKRKIHSDTTSAYFAKLDSQGQGNSEVEATSQLSSAPQDGKHNAKPLSSEAQQTPRLDKNAMEDPDAQKVAVKPLSELVSGNANIKKEKRRNRGLKRKNAAAHTEGAFPDASDEAKDRHS